MYDIYDRFIKKHPEIDPKSPGLTLEQINELRESGGLPPITEEEYQAQ